MPLAAISALIRAMASGIGTALLTRTMPSSLSALAGESADVSVNIRSNEVQRLKMRLVMGRLLSACARAIAWLHNQHGRMAPSVEIPPRSQVDSRALLA